MTDVRDAGGAMWDWPNQQVVRVDESGPGSDTPPVPKISGITPPGPFTNAATVPISIHGSNFRPTSAVTFDGSTPGVVTYVSPTQIDSQLEVTAVAPGVKDLSVINTVEGYSSQAFPVTITAA